MRRKKNHPLSLRTFFATEMWERYGFYVVQTLLALYLAFHFQWHDQQIYQLVGSFTALTYLSPLVGGWLADRFLGQKNSILIGAVILLVNYVILSTFQSTQWLIISLSGIAVGTGLLKPNISSLLGNAYEIDSPYRESGFMIFYMGITVGIILGTTIPNILNNYFGWSASFLSAAFGMLISICIFVLGIRKYAIQNYTHHEYRLSDILIAVFFMVLLWLVCFYILNYPDLANSIFLLVVLFATIYLVRCVRSESTESARKIIVIALLCLISVAFWAFYFQMFLSLTLFITRVIRSDLFGIPFPPPLYVGIQSVVMIGLGMILANKKQFLSGKNYGIVTGNKFFYAMLLITCAYAWLSFICHIPAFTTPISPLYIIPTYVLIALAELLLSPVGLAAISLLASKEKVSTMIGIFFVSLGLGAFLSGKLAILTAIPLAESSFEALKLHYATTFNYLLFYLLGATLVCVIFNRQIKRLLSIKCD